MYNTSINLKRTLLTSCDSSVFEYLFCVFFSGMTVNGFTNLFLLTLERRFHLSSTEVGFIAASNDIAAILLTSLVSFYGAYGNKIKWLGYGSFVTGKRISHHSWKSRVEIFGINTKLFSLS